MTAHIPVPLLQRLVPLSGHRVLVIDPGRRRLKLLVAESRLGKFRVLHRQSEPLPEEGALEPDELRQHLALVVPELGPHTVALVLPQHRIITQTVDVPEAHSATPREFLSAEARKLSGLGEDELTIGSTPLKPWGSKASPYTLVFCKQDEVSNLIERFGMAHSATDAPVNGGLLSEITTSAQGLVAASRFLTPPPDAAVLVDLGARETVVAMLHAGQGLFATSFEGGSDQFTRSLMESRQMTIDAAEALEKSVDLLQGRDAAPELVQAVEKWHGELRRCVAEWIEDTPELGLTEAGLTVYLAGGGAAQAGLVEFLSRLGPMRFRRWTALAEPRIAEPMDQYWVAYGVARIALGKEPRALSLLPPEFRKRRMRCKVWEAAQAAIAVLIVTAIAVLAYGTWQNSSLFKRKQTLLRNTEVALASARSIAELATRIETGYESIRPVIERRRQTLRTLQSWLALTQARTNDDFWLVLFADAASYTTGSTAPAPATNQVGTAVVPTPASPSSQAEFITEVCIPREGDAARQVLSERVGALKRPGVFANVDALPLERKREWVDPRVMISNHVYGLVLEMPAELFRRPTTTRGENQVSEEAEDNARRPDDRERKDREPAKAHSVPTNR